MSDNTPGSYERDVERASEEGTDFIERTDDLPPPDHYHAPRDLAELLRAGRDDLPPPDHYHAARDLAEMLRGRGEDLAALAGEIGLPDVDPARWERLDVARAASYARETYGDAFTRLVAAHPWLEDAAQSSAHDALGSLADRFLGH